MVMIREMFSPMGGPKKEEEQIDWLGDLKFFIDNNNSLLTHEIHPAVMKHKKYRDHPKAFKLYIKPLQKCANLYAREFDIPEPENKLPKEAIIQLAKQIANEQSNFISRGDYDVD